MLGNPKAAIDPLSASLHERVCANDAAGALAGFEELVAAYRAAKMDWSHTLSQTTALVAPLGLALVEPLLARLEVVEQRVRDATGPRYRTSPKLAPSDWEDARHQAAALRIALVRVLARSGQPMDERFDRFLGPEPSRLFEVPPKEGGKQHDFIARFLGGLQLGGAVLAKMPDARALAFIAAWRAFSPGKNLELNLKGLFRGRPRLLKAAAPAPTLVERARELAARTGLPCTVPVYIVERTKSDSLDRIGGRPKGLGAADLPRGMTPVLTVDLRSLPELAAQLPDVRALCLYVDSPRGGFDAATVVRLSEARAAAGIAGGKPFALARVEVPPQVFRALGDEGPLGALYTLLRQAEGRALGVPFFLQQDTPEAAPGFVLEAKAETLGLNLGDAGKLFMFVDHAFWESA